MENKKNKRNLSDIKDKTTKYGEVIPSQFSWVSIEEQKKKADELNKISEEKNSKH